MSKVTVTITREDGETQILPGNLCIVAVRNEEEGTIRLGCVGSGTPLDIANLLEHTVEKIALQQKKTDGMLTLLSVHNKADDLLKGLFDSINDVENEENGGNDNE